MSEPKYKILRVEGSLLGFRLAVDPEMSRDRIDLVQDGRVVARIENLPPALPPEGHEPEKPK